MILEEAQVFANINISWGGGLWSPTVKSLFVWKDLVKKADIYGSSPAGGGGGTTSVLV